MIPVTGTIEFDSLTFKFVADIEPGHSGKTSGRPEDCYPAEPDTIDAVSVSLISQREAWDKGGRAFTMTHEIPMSSEFTDELMLRHGLTDAIWEEFENVKQRAARDAAADKYLDRQAM
jgi:hypothetical protein